MDAATGHRVWLGELSAMTALSKGQIRARGPVAKILRLIDLIALVAPRYRAQIDALVAPGGPEDEAAEADTGAGDAEAAEAHERVRAAAEEEPAAEESRRRRRSRPRRSLRLRGLRRRSLRLRSLRRRSRPRGACG